uniref:Uncharacterized protein n=1 Tax=Rhizophora mucronata TaxID=61149 RepID=A0A2P2PCC4_RHIMU
MFLGMLCSCCCYTWLLDLRHLLSTHNTRGQRED